ncbi:MAG: hypothetical protein GXP35_15075 [Actinobacteria bacterium]|nr:hypothetical protein [Actinomycetota bacterium]
MGTVQFKIVDAQTGEDIGGLIWDTSPGAGASAAAGNVWGSRRPLRGGGLF